MASEVDLCNLALSHLGDDATIASIDPPEGSAQSEHCARWYPIARNSLLEMYDWGFATTRAILAEVDNPFQQWQHAYARPQDCLKILAILPEGAANGWPGGVGVTGLGYAVGDRLGGIQVAQPYKTETDAAGNPIILTPTANAVIQYTRLVTDTSKFPPLFVDALARYLASYLAGPILKGTTGIQVGNAQIQLAMGIASRAALSSANQNSRQQSQAYPWVR